MSAAEDGGEPTRQRGPLGHERLVVSHATAPVREGAALPSALLEHLPGDTDRGVLREWRGLGHTPWHRRLTRRACGDRRFG